MQAVRFHPYGHVVRVGLADRWYVDCTGGWRKFEESEARLFCGRGTRILCRAAKDKTEVPFSIDWTDDEKTSGTRPNTAASGESSSQEGIGFSLNDDEVVQLCMYS